MTPKKGRRQEPLAAQLLRDLEEDGTGHRWPSARWRDDPVAFAREVLLVEQLTPEQEEILRTMSKPRARGAVSSGHKTGKDYLAGVIALWWFCSWSDARVRITAVTGLQLRDVLWREIRAHHERSQRGPYPIDGDPAMQPHGGLRVGLREIVGFTVRDKEAAAGISGPHVLYIFDEASGIDDEIFEASKGNLAGGDARVLMLSQPTRNVGEFYDAFHSKRELWSCFTLRSDLTPNVREGGDVIPGLATMPWLEEQAIDWGAPARWREIARGLPVPDAEKVGGPVWMVRVWGQFAEGGAATVIPLSLVEAAEKKWTEMATPARERLVVGPDVAKQGGDENVAAPRRGLKILELDAWMNSPHLQEAELAAACARRAMETVRRLREPREPKAVVNVDSTGSFGIQVAGALRAYASEIEVVAVNFGAFSPLRLKYRYLRDQLWFAFADWLKGGGALPPDRKLPAELMAPGFDHDELGRRQVERKTKLKTKLGRSTDRADACLLAAYEAQRTREAAPEDEEAEAPPEVQLDLEDRALDPYAALDAWR